MTYTGPVYLGHLTPTRLDVVYDTGSDWLAIEGISCSTCTGDAYDTSLS
jgi:hypothetical protein